jgi:outer membrane receptor protein involved in Fe transport
LETFPRLIVNSALWYLYLQQEFVYVGDAGIIEPSGKTKRMGADLGLRYQLNDYLYFDADANYTYARSIDEPVGKTTFLLRFYINWRIKFSKMVWTFRGLRYRYLKVVLQMKIIL